jgi:hypothetical protein
MQHGVVIGTPTAAATVGAAAMGLAHGGGPSLSTVLGFSKLSEHHLVVGSC